MKPTAVCTITMIESEDGFVDVVVSSHPHDCQLEQFAAGVLNAIRATIDAAKVAPPNPELNGREALRSNKLLGDSEDK